MGLAVAGYVGVGKFANEIVGSVWGLEFARLDVTIQSDF